MKIKDVCNWGGEVIILDRVSRKTFTKKVTFEYRPKRDEGSSLAGVQEKTIPKKENSKCKGPEAKEYLVFLKNNKEARKG